MKPAVTVGKPNDTGKFDAFQVDGLTVYLQKGLDVQPEGLEIVARKFGLFKWLEAKGLVY